jgi:hypothetical protein
MRSTVTGLAAVSIAGTLLGVLWAASSAPRQQQPQPQAQAQPAPPGGDPEMQQWLSRREALQIELNNTLVEAQRLAAPSAQATTTCDRLTRVSQQLLGSGRSSHPELDATANAGINQFTQAGRACLAGDFAKMRSQIDDGTTLRSDAADICVACALSPLGRQADAQQPTAETTHGEHNGS